MPSVSWPMAVMRVLSLMVPDAGAAGRRQNAARARPGWAEARVVAGLSAGGGLGEVGGAGDSIMNR